VFETPDFNSVCQRSPVVEQLFRNEPPAEFRIDFKHKAPAQIDKQVQTVANFINFSGKNTKT